MNQTGIRMGRRGLPGRLADAPPLMRAMRRLALFMALGALGALGACASREQGYGVGPQAQAEMQMRAAVKDPAPDTPGMYLGLIERMQSEGLYYASLAHIDAYEHQYGVSPDSIALRADALRATHQPVASAAAYRQLLTTPLAARGHRGLGLLAGAAGDFHEAERELGEAARLEPTDAHTLSDYGYALLREGELARARVPLLQAFELDSHDRKIGANVALYFAATGEGAKAQELMAQQDLPADARAAVEHEAADIARVQQRAREVERTRTALASAAVPSLPSATSGARANSPLVRPLGDAQPRLVPQVMQ